jgi:hypothetical protein
MLVFYGLATALCARVLWDHYPHVDEYANANEDPAPIVAVLYGFVALVGLVTTIRLYMQGVPPPAGMAPAQRQALEGESVIEIDISEGNKKWQMYFVGEEARPLSAAAPFLVMMVMTCCCVPVIWAVVRIANG